MKKKMKVLAGVFFMFAIISCKKDEKGPDPVVEQPAVETAACKIQISHLAGSENLELQKYYLNPKGDSVSFTRFVYYISNLVLTADDGTSYVEPASYHLIDQSQTSSMGINLTGVPAKKYTKLSFMIGVDSLRNVSGSQTGDLAPSKGMFWTWSTGYIFLKIEGKATKSPTKGITYHVGGYKGIYKGQRSVTLDFSASPLQIKTAAVPVLNINVDIMDAFKTPTLLDVSTFYYQMNEGPGAKTLADNYADMFTVKNITN